MERREMEVNRPASRLTLEINNLNVTGIKQMNMDTVPAAELDAGLFTVINKCFSAPNQPNQADGMKILETLVQHGASINAVDEEGRSPLYLAVTRGMLPLVKRFIALGADVNAGKESEEGQAQPIHMASKRNNVHIVRALINAGADVNNRNWGGNTPLVIAVRFNNDEVIKELLSIPQCNFELKNHLGQAPLHYAAVNGDPDIVRLLLDRGCNVNARTLVGVSPLMLALERHHCEIVDMLLKRKANINHLENLCGATPLHWAVGGGCEHCVKALLKVGADIQREDFSGRTSVMQAVQSRRPGALKVLLQSHKHYPGHRHRKNPITKLRHWLKGKSKRGLHGIQNGKKPVENLHEWDIIADNMYALHLAASLGHIECTNVLLDHGWASLVDYPDCFGDTPIMIAERFTHRDILLLLMDQQVDEKVSHQNGKHGDTPNQEGSGSSPIQRTTERLGNMKIDVYPASPPKLFKTYSPIKMSMINILITAGKDQMLVPPDFDFDSWLDDSPSAFTLKVNTYEFSQWLHDCVGSPFSLRELCRCKLRQSLGYRASEKAYKLDIPHAMQHYIAMKELDELDSSKIKVIRSALVSYPYRPRARNGPT